MSNETKGQMIGAIISQLKLQAASRGLSFDEGDTFFSLAFKSDEEICRIAKLCGV